MIGVETLPLIHHLKVMAFAIHIFVFLTLTLGLTNGELCEEKICRYEFMVREGRSMMYAVKYATGWQDVYDVVLNGSRLHLKSNDYHKTVPDVSHEELSQHSNPLDGVPRTLIMINGRYKGPTIEVMEGAQVVVKVVNNLQKQSLSIHWHGMHQRSTMYSDGVPYITQCPISSGQSFTYRFYANPAGTHWYHSHTSNQKADGVYGGVIIHRKPPVVPYSIFVISDWYHVTSTELETLNPYATFDKGSGVFHSHNLDKDNSFDGVKLSSLTYVSGLINGRGRYDNNQAPLSYFHVTKGQTIQFHIVGALSEYAYRISIDQHSLTVIESDGFPVQPVRLQSLIIFGGETYVIEVEADQPIQSYWIKAETLKDGEGPFVRKEDKMIPKAQVLAVFHYEGADNRTDPTSLPRNCTSAEPCHVLNCPWRAYPAKEYPYTECINVDQLRSDGDSLSNAEQSTDEEILSPTADIHELFLNFAFATGSSINMHRFIFPKSSPVYDSRTELTPCVEECFDDGCRCTNVLELPKNKIIQLILMSYTTTNDPGKNYTSMGHHPVHLHGHSFHVLKQGFGVMDNQTNLIADLNQDIICDNKPCSRQHWKDDMTQRLNFDQPPVKDTVIVPSSGYVVVRFRSDNPGFWLMHCHTMFHITEGMMLVFNESFPDMQQPPKSLPQCNSFEMEDGSFDAWVGGNDKTRKEPLKSTSCGNTEILLYVVITLSVISVISMATSFYLFCNRDKHNKVNGSMEMSEK
ncbi:uncharacterized protein [Clytia hemisphaerica]|uniref:Uncharacterized protein n=1 Tax=Clytia hemisphaerica TaxID=252671 RepID=A0A7M5U5Q1_9CNID